MKAAYLILGMALFATGFWGCGESEKSGGRPDGSSDASGDANGDASGDAQGPGEASCQSDVDCDGEDEVCDCLGRCREVSGVACQDDKACGIPYWCNLCTGHCEEQGDVCDSCGSDSACKGDGRCLSFRSGGMFCGRACISDAGCPPAYACLELSAGDKQCVPKSQECTVSLTCEDDYACPVGEICQDLTGLCAPGCEDDRECQGESLCVSARCVSPCAGDGDCRGLEKCMDGRCKIPGSCESRSDCLEPETYCDKATGQCEAGCQIDLDCGDASLVCVSGACERRGCKHNYECAYAEVCDKDSGSCVPFPEDLPYCAPCGEGAGSSVCDSPNICATMLDENEEERGDFCMVPCADDPIDRCPSGWDCQVVGDPQSSGSGDAFCVRSCYINPVGD